ncbi:butyrophilin subfamily 1 member A1 [Sphaeramia orbicularis]|uniref:Butyrophilin subfamily 1 member A1-like n=1 Tax=Sphaeramia orbicularis TaxID=375764 RepID=A0A672YAN7_9TELE|nr:butyrophilin subfamily 1 member A1-like [Sphaeramia orbicularis]
MDWAVLLILQVMLQPAFSVLFTVEAEQTMYQSEYGGDVVMGCKFQPIPSNSHSGMTVSWDRVSSSPMTRVVYQIKDGVEHLESQDPAYQGRASLLTDGLEKGWAKLKVSKLGISDSGTYRCIVRTNDGFDYKTISLSVIAPYKTVTKHIQKTAEGDGVLLTCQSEGYPESEVLWHNGHLQSLKPNTTSVSTAEQLYKVTSQIHVTSSDKNNYTCSFGNGGASATFHIPDEMPQAKNDAIVVSLCFCVILVAMVIIIVLLYRRKEFITANTPNTRNQLVDNLRRVFSSAACFQKCTVSDEERTKFNTYDQTDLEAILKNHYSKVMETERWNQWEVFCVEELLHRLQNNNSQPAKLQDLLPDDGEILFLEGPPGSGKTTIAHILVSSWTEGPTRVLPNLPDLSSLHLLLYVDCSRVKGDLFQEITTQLSLAGRVSVENELRTMLTSEALLLLDGYKEGNHLFDESLKRFLCDRGGCRVLVTACPGHCPILRETVGTVRLKKLQMQTQKY